MAQGTIANSSVLFPEDVKVYIAAWSSAYTTLQELTSAAWINVGSLSEFSIEAANETVQPPSFNVEHTQLVTKEQENINITIQEINSSVVAMLRGSLSQQTSTTWGASSWTVDLLYSGGGDRLTPFVVWTYSKYSDGRSKSVYYPWVHYVSGGAAATPKGQGSGEYMDMAFTLQARESTAILYNTRRVYKIELNSTAST